MGRQKHSSPRGACSESLEARRLFAVITVNTTSDADTRDSVLSLREAIKLVDGTLSVSSLSVDEAAQVVGAVGVNDAIQFNLPGSGVQTISPSDALPPITSAVTIDGYSQTGAAPATDITPATLLVRLSGGGGDTGDAMIVAGPDVTIRGLAIDNFNGNAIVLSNGSEGDVIAGNYLGVTPDGMTAEGNFNGVAVDDTDDVRIGGPNPADRNVISGNETGISLGQSVNGALIEGNYVGTDASGAHAVGNEHNGILVEDALFVTIGGSDAGDENVISGNGDDGILFSGGPSDAISDNDVVQGNLIGTNADGDGAVANGQNGVEILGGGEIPSRPFRVLIGGSDTVERNVISGNPLAGILIDTSGASETTVEGNIIGADALVTASIANGDGILIQGDDGNLIGGTDEGAGNTILGNTLNGIHIEGGSNNTVQGNFIGGTPIETLLPPSVLQRDAAPADVAMPPGNQGDGVLIEGASTQNVIGGATFAASNFITDNGRDGVEVSSSGASVPTQNSIRFNSIFNNAGLGIDLDVAGGPSGVTPNDPGDGDTGSNDLQNFPIVSSATVTTSTVSVSGTFNSVPNGSYVLDFYGTFPTGSGEDPSHLGSITVSTNATGDATYSGTFNFEVSPIGIAATATVVMGNSDGDTSEISPSVTVGAPTPPTPPTPPTSPTSPLPTSDAPTLAGDQTTLRSLQALLRAFSGSKPQAASIKKMLATTTHQLNSAAALVKKQTALSVQYTKETGLIAAMQVQLAAQSSASGKAKIQKKINADTAAQAKALNQDKTVSTSAESLLNTVGVSEGTIQSELNPVST